MILIQEQCGDDADDRYINGECGDGDQDDNKQFSNLTFPVQNKYCEGVKYGTKDVGNTDAEGRGDNE